MTSIDLNSLSLAELKRLQKDLAKAISGYDENKKAEARAVLAAKAREMGFDLGELLGTATRKTRAAAEPKYRNPDDATKTWSGRGRKPHWFLAAISEGRTIESLEV